MSLPIQVLPSDRKFDDSPDAGEATCLCSRCGQVIGETNVPIRVFVYEGRDGEYRYHARCVGLADEGDDEGAEWDGKTSDDL